MALSPGVLALLALMVANAALAVAAPHPVWPLLGMGLFLCAAARLLALVPAGAVMLAPFVVLHAAMLLSLLVIEGGAFMKEMGTAGHASPAGAAFVLCSALFLGSAALVFARFERRHAARPQPRAGMSAAQRQLLCAAGLGAGAAVVAWLALKGLRVGFPLLTGMDRFVFRAYGADTLTLNLLNLKYVLAALLGCNAVWAPGAWWRRAHHGVFGGYVLVSFLFGDKFFIILMATCFYAMPFAVAHPVGIAGRVRRAAPLGLLALVCASLVTYFIYSAHGQLDVALTLERLRERVAGQGQLWFLAVRDSSALMRLEVQEMGLNLANLVARPPADFTFEHRLAPFHFVERYTPAVMYQAMVNIGGIVTPTMVFEAYALVLGGYVGLSLMLLAAGTWTGWLAHRLHRAMAGGNPVEVMLPAFAMFQTIVLMSQGTLHSLLSLSAFKAYGAFLALQWLVGAWLRHGRVTPALQGA